MYHPRLLAELNRLIEVLRSATDSKAFEEAVWQYRRTINHEYAGPRLQAAIRASQSFIPHVFWPSYAENQEMMLPFYEKEHAVIRRRDPAAARAACEGRSASMARIVVHQLVRRGVLNSADDLQPLAPTAASLPHDSE